MSVKIVFVITLSLLLQASLSLPISLDVKTVQSTDSVPENRLTKRTTVLDSETNIRLEEDDKLVQSFSTETLLNAFESVEADHGKRIKRHITTTYVLCSDGTIEYLGQCITPEKLEDGDGPEGSDDYVAES